MWNILEKMNIMRKTDLQIRCDVCKKYFWLWEKKVRNISGTRDRNKQYSSDFYKQGNYGDKVRAYAICVSCEQFHEEETKRVEQTYKERLVREQKENAQESDRIRPLVRKWLENAPIIEDSVLAKSNETSRLKPVHLSIDEILERVIGEVVNWSDKNYKSHKKDKNGIPNEYKNIFEHRDYISHTEQRFMLYSGGIHRLADGQFVIMWEGPFDYSRTPMDDLA